MRLRFASAVAAWVVASACPPVEAAPVAVVNPGFEDISGESPYNEFTFGPLSGWSLYDPFALAGSGAGPSFFIGTLTPTAPTFFTAGAAEGNRVGIAFNYAASGTGAYGMFQTLSATLQANTTYTLQVEIGNIASGTAVDSTFYDLSGFPGYRIDLLAGGNVIAQDLNSLAGSIAEGAFATSTVSLTTGAAPAFLGQPLGIRLVNLNAIDPGAPGADREIDFDDVRLDASPVPEPSGAALVALAAAGWAGRRRRR
jgi:hypothetical protein